MMFENIIKLLYYIAFSQFAIGTIVQTFLKGWLAIDAQFLLRTFSNYIIVSIWIVPISQTVITVVA